MKNKLFLITSLIISLSFASIAIAATNENESRNFKRWNFKTGVEHIERQGGRMDYNRLSRGYEGPWDLGEDGDVTTVFTDIRYKLNEKWYVDYRYARQWINNIESYGKGYGKNKAFNKNADRDTANVITHVVKVGRTFDEFTFLNKKWKSSMYIGYHRQDESGIEGTDVYKDGSSSKALYYDGFTSNRILFNYNMSTELTDRITFILNEHYEYRSYTYDHIKASHQHRNWLTPTFLFKINDATTFNFTNHIYSRYHSGASSQDGPGFRVQARSYLEWAYDYKLTHVKELSAGYSLVSELGTWGEVGVARAGREDLFPHQQAEIVLMPKIKKTFKLDECSTLDAYIGAGYVYGYDPNTFANIYDGFEGRFGAVISVDF